MNTPTLPFALASLVEHLPDEPAARRFAARLAEEQPSQAKRVWKRPEALSWMLILSSYSPWLAETLLQRPEFLTWIERDAHLQESKSPEQLREELARFAATHSDLDPSVILSRFKRREWIRIYLRDCLNLCTLSELTEELSHVADAVLQFSVDHCLSALSRRYGTPSVKDARGRSVPATFAVLGLGKLGSRELNYSSDIDLMFLFSGLGDTTGGIDGGVRNREFFTRMAEYMLKLVGSPTAPEGAAFRIDVRLRPHGRDGALVVSVQEAVSYYRAEAQNWEHLAMIRARGCAGDIHLAQEFLDAIRDTIYRPEPLADALRDVRLSKEKIDRKQAERTGGYNVKLGKGGIREIEFITQALQVCHGGRDPWLRVPQTLIGMQRLTEKGHLTESERTQLTEALTFLRTCEHRLQMDQGAQTHSIPLDEEKLGLLARRMGYQGPHAARKFALALARHRDHVTKIYDRVFAGVPETTIPEPIVKRTVPSTPGDALRQKILNLLATPDSGVDSTELTDCVAVLDKIIHTAPDPARVLTLLRDVVASWAAYVRDQKSSDPPQTQAGDSFSKGDTTKIVHRDFDVTAWERHSAPKTPELLKAAALAEIAVLCESGEYFALLLTRHPHLIPHLGKPVSETDFSRESFLGRFQRELEGRRTHSEAVAGLRKIHRRALLDIGRSDIVGGASLKTVNLAQTALADASLESAARFARRLLVEANDFSNPVPEWTILGLGRLGHRGLDYGSDLDIIAVYDDSTPPPSDHMTSAQAVVKMTETTSSLLSTLTAEGMMYRVDLRLRPDGRNGALAVGKRALLHYLRERAASWEHLAYLKVRPAAGNLTMGEGVQREIREAIFEFARNRGEALRYEIRDMRMRLQTERGGRDAPRDYKFGPGGMMDVYFITRYAQMRHAVADPSEYGTLPLIDHLASHGALNEATGNILREGYAFLRKLDHAMRLLSERHSSRLPVQTETLARILKFPDGASLESEYLRRTKAIRACFTGMFG